MVPISYRAKRYFSSYPIYQQLLPPSNEIAPAWLLASVDQAAFQQQQTPGPVHLNCAFREPLYPVEAATAASPCATRFNPLV